MPEAVDLLNFTTNAVANTADTISLPTGLAGFLVITEATAVRVMTGQSAVNTGSLKGALVPPNSSMAFRMHPSQIVSVASSGTSVPFTVQVIYH